MTANAVMKMGAGESNMIGPVYSSGTLDVMSGKGLIWGGMFVGSTIGGMVPYLWSGDIFTLTLWSTIGGLLGIWAGFKLAKATGAL